MLLVLVFELVFRGHACLWLLLLLLILVWGDIAVVVAVKLAQVKKHERLLFLVSFVFFLFSTRRLDVTVLV